MSAVREAADRAKAWLTDVALPLWARIGVDPDGAFYETVDFQGRPDLGSQRRMRVQARQLYVFAQADEQGWLKGADAIAARGFQRMIGDCWARDGRPGFLHTLTAQRQPADQTRDAYDQAFGLFALAWRYKQAGDAEARRIAGALTAFLGADMAHPAGGVVESLPTALPRRSNPHMHLLEAYLAWAELTGEAVFIERAADIVSLFQQHFFDSETATYGEFFTDGLAVDPGPAGLEVWPGHHFEWVWLLAEARRLGVADAGEQASQLYDWGMTHGLDEAGFAIDECDRQGRPVRTSRRAWNQTELIKAHIAVGAGEAAALVTDAFLDSYLGTEIPGLWMDVFDAEGRGVAANVPASTLYHVVVAFRELIQFAEGQGG